MLFNAHPDVKTDVRDERLDFIDVLYIDANIKREINVYRSRVRSKDHKIKQLLSLGENPIETASLSSLWPGHAIRSLDLGFGALKVYREWHRYTFSNEHGAMDEVFCGNAVIYKVEKSVITNVELTPEEVQAAIVVLGRRK